MNEAILTLNAGSSSIKLSAYEVRNGDLKKDAIISGEISGLDSNPIMRLTKKTETHNDVRDRLEPSIDHAGATDLLLAAVNKLLDGRNLAGVGHRVVHGGIKYTSPCILTPEAIDDLRKLTPLAPGHQPANLEGIAKAQIKWPDVPQVACFDTSFHRTQPTPATQFAIPRNMLDDGVIRYGFHGLSYEYIASAAPEIIGAQPRQRMIVAHLGSGASMCAIKNGQSVATTMGFTALDGLPMGTRCGNLDAGVVLYLLQEKKLKEDEIAEILYERSGLLGMSEISSDMRVLADSDDPYAEEAIAYFVYRSIREIGSLTAALGGLDALVFTAGIGENSPKIRTAIIEKLDWLGFELDETANESNKLLITKRGATPTAWVAPTNEELMIARHTHQLVAAN